MQVCFLCNGSRLPLQPVKRLECPQPWYIEPVTAATALLLCSTMTHAMSLVLALKHVEGEKYARTRLTLHLNMSVSDVLLAHVSPRV